MKDGQWYGLVTEWYQNGQKWQEFTWNHGRVVGFECEWDEEGNLIKEINHSN